MDLSKQFSNIDDASCPIMNYTLLNSFERPMVETKHLKMLSIRGNMLSMRPSEPDVFRFFVKATTEAGVFATIFFDMDIEVDPTLKPYEIAANDGP